MAGAHLNSLKRTWKATLPSILHKTKNHVSVSSHFFSEQIPEIQFKAAVIREEKENREKMNKIAYVASMPTAKS